MTARIAVLASGRGSNLQAILDAIADGRLDAEVVGVFSDRPSAPALRRVAAELRWAAMPNSFADKAAYEQALGDALAASAPDWVICAGYMRILGDALIARFAGRLLNVHPSLLPRHRGLNTHAQALAAGDTVHGASLHFVIPELDAGAVIAQVRLPVMPDDTAETLAARLLPREHALMVAVAMLAAEGRLAERDGQVWIDAQCLFRPLQLDCAGKLHPESHA